MLYKELRQMIADELNVKEVLSEEVAGEAWKIKKDGNRTVALNTAITDALKKEGLMLIDAKIDEEGVKIEK